MTPCGRCGAPNARPYPSGQACPQHTPAALAGRSEPGSTATPYVPQTGALPITTTIIDDRAVAKGARASNPHERAQAVAREEARRAAHQAAYDQARAASMSARLRLPLPTDEQEQLVAGRQQGRAIQTVLLPEEVSHG